MTTQTSSESECNVVQQKKMYKVISPVQNKAGETIYWTRLGSAFTNKDDSLNVVLDAFPKTFQLQIRELDAEDLRKRELHQASARAPGLGEVASESTRAPHPGEPAPF